MSAPSGGGPDQRIDAAGEPAQNSESSGFRVVSRFALPASLDALGDVLKTAPNPEAVFLALHARSVIRREQDSHRANLMPQFAWQAGHIVAVADHVLEQLNTPWQVDEVGTTESELWAAQLREALDVFARICWCLRFGHTFAAVALARRFIERWTYNLAFSTDVNQEAEERDQDFIERVWSTYARRVDPHGVASDWSALSELLHGRAATAGPDPLPLITLAVPVDTRRAVHDFIVSACEAPLFQICASVNTVAVERGVMTAQTHALLLARPADFPSEPFPESLDPEIFLHVFREPLTVEFVRSEGVEVALSWERFIAPSSAPGQSDRWR